MKCPMCGQDDVESGDNYRVSVEKPDRTIRKLVCQRCAEDVENTMTISKTDGGHPASFEEADTVDRRDEDLWG